jgi:hypothetical protein
MHTEAELERQAVVHAVRQGHYGGKAEEVGEQRGEGLADPAVPAMLVEALLAAVGRDAAVRRPLLELCNLQ